MVTARSLATLSYCKHYDVARGLVLSLLSVPLPATCNDCDDRAVISIREDFRMNMEGSGSNLDAILSNVTWELTECSYRWVGCK
jgi:hypothetical protein